MKASAQLTRCYPLSALHVLALPGLTLDDNLAIFGPCARRHGHDYQVQVTVAGEINAETGRLVEREALDRVVNRVLILPFDGSHLNDHFANTTGEALARAFYDLLAPALEGVELVRITLVETAKNTFIYPG